MAGKLHLPADNQATGCTSPHLLRIRSLYGTATYVQPVRRNSTRARRTEKAEQATALTHPRTISAIPHDANTADEGILHIANRLTGYLEQFL